MDLDDELTVWCGNLPSEIDEELLYELFLQAAPLKRVKMITDAKTGKPANFAFVTFKHLDSVPYAIQLLHGTRIYDRSIVVRARNNQNAQQKPQMQNSQQSPQQMNMDGNRHNRNQRFNPLSASGGRNSYRDEKRGSNYRNNYNNHNRYDADHHNRNTGRRRY